MNTILSDLSGVNVVTDDILVYGAAIQEHNIRLEAVLKRVRDVNLKFNPHKVKICKTQVNYVGHALTQEGLKPSMECIQAITEMLTANNKADI